MGDISGVIVPEFIRRELSNTRTARFFRDFRPGLFELNVGCMYSGKTNDLIETYHTCKIQSNHHCVPITHTGNTRDNSGGYYIRSRKPEGNDGIIERKIPAIPVESAEELFSKIIKYAMDNIRGANSLLHVTILQDEPWLHHSDHVIVSMVLKQLGFFQKIASLSESYRGTAMPYSDEKKTIYDLAKQADIIRRYTARCAHPFVDLTQSPCWAPAEFTQRFSGKRPSSFDEPLFVIEGSDEAKKLKHTYHPACREHFRVRDHPDEETIKRNLLPFSKVA
ncbi:MAG: hypothetical protein QW331_02670 [Candidatus Woesearchaeota archaeon]